MDIFLQKRIDSLQEAFINPRGELYGELYLWKFIGLLNITHSLLITYW